MKFKRITLLFLLFTLFSNPLAAKEKSTKNQRGIELKHKTKNKTKFIKEGKLINVILKDSAHTSVKGYLLVIDSETISIEGVAIAMNNIHFIKHNSVGKSILGAALAIPGTLLVLGTVLAVAYYGVDVGDPYNVLSLVYVALPGLALSGIGYPLLLRGVSKDLTYNWNATVSV